MHRIGEALPALVAAHVLDDGIGKDQVIPALGDMGGQIARIAQIPLGPFRYAGAQRRLHIDYMDVLGPYRCMLPGKDAAAKIEDGHLGQIRKGLGQPARPLFAPTPTERVGLAS
jgi:hypothetical protein